MEKILYVGTNATYQNEVCQALIHQPTTLTAGFCSKMKHIWSPVKSVPCLLATVANNVSDIKSFSDIEEAHSYVLVSKLSNGRLPEIILIDVDQRKKNGRFKRDDMKYQGAQLYFGYRGETKIPTFVLSEQPPEETDGKIPGCFFFSKQSPIKVLVDSIQCIVEQERKSRRVT